MQTPPRLLLDDLIELNYSYLIKFQGCHNQVQH